MLSSALDAPVLVVASDPHLGHAIAEQLLADGFSVELARTAEHARVLARTSAPKLVVLCPRSGAIDLLREIRDGPPRRAVGPHDAGDRRRLRCARA